jgi:hypothetical protein
VAAEVTAAAAVAGAAVVVGAAAVGDDEEGQAMRIDETHRSLLVASAAFSVALGALPAGAADTPAQKRFARPEEAVRAVVAAARAGDTAAMLALLGPGGEEIVSSGDPVADAAERKRFVAAASERTRLETLDGGEVVVHAGKDDWPLPIPLVKDAEGWRFDTAAGKEELLNRRIGRNELGTIEACRAYVDAQREYAARERTRNGVRAYAQRIRSEAGKHDGLFWEDATGKDESPLGPLFGEAAAEGYVAPEAGTGPQPYHGYFYRVLTAQGAHAPGGARSYLKDGQMTGGFALVAYPAEHGASGLMTFLVGPEGIVYQKDLGEKTAELAKAMTFDPDESWMPVR